jgi:thiamine-phosphate pyrophosphorylase
MKQSVISGLYAVTPDEQDTDALAAKVQQALDGGARLIQYRNKLADTPMRYAQSLGLLALCRPHNVPLIINDHLDIALTIEADGVHLGAEDGDLAAARRALGPGKLLGASCYNRFDLAQKARDAGADYVAFGAAFASPTKPHAVSATLELYARARAELGIPVVAIGGITTANAHLLLEAGVDAVAVITDLFNAPDITATARQFSQLFSPSETPVRSIA